jgi:oligopeptide transport system ATP-binding protein
MEQSCAQHIFHNATHPYTLGLLRAVPRMDSDDESLIAIPGAPPNMAKLPKGCPFSARCTLADVLCAEAIPELSATKEGGNFLRACHRDVLTVQQHAGKEPLNV